LLLTGAGQLSVLENGTSRGTFGPYVTGDVLRVQVQGNVVSYLRNGAPLFASKVAPKYPLLLDTSLSGPGASTIDGAVIFGLLENVMGMMRRTALSASSAGGVLQALVVDNPQGNMKVDISMDFPVDDIHETVPITAGHIELTPPDGVDVTTPDGPGKLFV